MVNIDNLKRQNILTERWETEQRIKNDKAEKNICKISFISIYLYKVERQWTSQNILTAHQKIILFRLSALIHKICVNKKKNISK